MERSAAARFVAAEGPGADHHDHRFARTRTEPDDSPAALGASHKTVDPDDTEVLHGVPVTNLARTWRELARN